MITNSKKYTKKKQKQKPEENKQNGQTEPWGKW